MTQWTAPEDCVFLDAGKQDLTIRHDRLDNFWFSLLHELAHVGVHLNDPGEWFVDDFGGSAIDWILSNPAFVSNDSDREWLEANVEDLRGSERYFDYNWGANDAVNFARSYHAAGAHFLLVDGSTRFVSNWIDLPIYQAAGREFLPPFPCCLELRPLATERQDLVAGSSPGEASHPEGCRLI